MYLTDYRALLIDCDDVLVDRDSGIWTALQPLLENHSDRLDREAVLAAFDEAVRTLYPRFAELGFSGLLCFAHRQLAERFGLKASWEEGMSFARSVGNWSLFEDAPGAMLYLRKFYRLLVCCDRDAADREQLCERLGITPEDLLSRVSNPLEDSAWLQANKLKPEDILQVSRPPAEPPKSAGLCLIYRDHGNDTQQCPADFCINSMADLVAQHQRSLHR
ncbi:MULTISPECIES: HAD family hydrolase [Pseudomonas]|uniref:2-haloalkanoic acid dehalogenase n=1 Tax=Pseudomonas lini TaxID=163011 RepID=A0A0J6HLD6_9PSED|nr:MULTISPECIES: 2-haloalkanoic acid dehalogenase [Pseudomonas]KAB0507430.1 2-haloalkanoic acid dehalogenase [Pseudomonas lini]KMM95293.1 2-haloalkanoic acid dehalogenase [Pseudomonas lini]KNH45963.1 2-haloalkanoic acid dehalogenase [Pseudomonas lini]MDT9673462.1 2-haloalkanoic acid dehalogenase [Pseudomonas sp. JV414]SDT32981.1 FMN phosphatase YigB, HAD superfamily [Pseudomonas lini]